MIRGTLGTRSETLGRAPLATAAAKKGVSCSSACAPLEDKTKSTARLSRIATRMFMRRVLQRIQKLQMALRIDCWLGRPHPVSVHRLRNVVDQLLAEVGISIGELAFDRIVNISPDADTAGLRKFLQPRS
jgi:hypothetical protein